jgi:hypothetical protein
MRLSWRAGVGVLAAGTGLGLVSVELGSSQLYHWRVRSCKSLATNKRDASLEACIFFAMNVWVSLH